MNVSEREQKIFENFEKHLAVLQKAPDEDLQK